MGNIYKEWTASDTQFIANNQHLPDEYIAKQLSDLTGQNISKAMIRRQRRKLGITRTRGRPSNVTKSILEKANDPTV